MFWEMVTGVLILGLVSSVLLPLLGPARPWAVADLRGARRLELQEKERLLRLIKDLDAEREREAIDPAEHERLRRDYLLQAAQVQRRLDAEPSEGSARGDGAAQEAEA